MSLLPSDLVGAWAFGDWTITYEDGRTNKPMQPNPGGLLIYASSGVMSVVMHSGGRKPLSSRDLQKVSESEKAKAFDGYFHYSGTWAIRGDQVVHAVSSALNPNMIGTDQVPNVDLKGDDLILSLTEKLDGGRGQRFHRLAWKRVTSGGRVAHD